MTSDLKPRVRSKKKANYRLYVLLACVAGLGYWFFIASGTATSVKSMASAGTKLESAASAITKGISGTSKDMSKVMKNEASAKDKETHELVHEMKKQAASVDVADDVGLLGEAVDSASTGSRESYLTTSHGNKEVSVSPTDKGKGRTSKSQAFDAADTLNVLFESYEMIVFSKTYCPHSKRAKSILEFYDIRPKPLIFELDVEDHGAELQQELAKQTGRSTVPNVIVHGTSIGGGDDMANLDKTDKLVSKVRSLSDTIDITRKALRNE